MNAGKTKKLMGIEMTPEMYAEALKFMANYAKQVNAGVYNFCVNGECIGCGECCSNLLPMTDREVKKIRKVVRKNQLKPINHVPVPMVNAYDNLCPFRDDSRGDKKCVIYNIRPWVCRSFKCDQYGANFKYDDNLPEEECTARLVRETFWEKDGTIK